MKKILAIAALSILAACAATAPTDNQVAQIQTACAVDAGIRPSVTALMVFATPKEEAAITAARAVIDPICANPAAPLQSTAISTFSAAAAQVVGYYAQLQARKSTPAAVTPAASAPGTA